MPSENHPSTDPGVTAPDSDQAPEVEAVIPIVAEQAHVRMEREHTGTVRVRKVVHQRAAELDVSNFREDVEVVRVPVGRVVDTAAASRQEGDVLIVPIHEERWIKQVVLVEEVHITRRRTAQPESARVELTKEEVIVERLDPGTGQWHIESA